MLVDIDWITTRLLAVVRNSSVNITKITTKITHTRVLWVLQYIINGAKYAEPILY